MAREVIRVRNEFYIRSSSARVDVRTRVLKQGDTFAVFDRFGDIETFGTGELGLYYQDTRFLSRLTLKLGKDRPLLLSSTVREDNAVMAVDATNSDAWRDSEIMIPRGTLHVFRAASNPQLRTRSRRCLRRNRIRCRFCRHFRAARHETRTSRSSLGNGGYQGWACDRVRRIGQSRSPNTDRFRSTAYSAERVHSDVSNPAGGGQRCQLPLRDCVRSRWRFAKGNQPLLRKRRGGGGDCTRTHARPRTPDFYR